MSTIASLRETLERYVEHFPAETAMAERIMALLQSRTNCADRDCFPGHLTGSAWVVSADGQRSLLMLHRKLGKWLQPGGHADGELDLAQVALREAREETGLTGLEVVPDATGLVPLDVDVHAIPARFDSDGRVTEPAHEHHDVRFLLRATDGETFTQNEESHELRWCCADEVYQLTQETSVIRLLEKAHERLDAR